MQTDSEFRNRLDHMKKRIQDSDKFSSLWKFISLWFLMIISAIFYDYKFPDGHVWLALIYWPLLGFLGFYTLYFSMKNRHCEENIIVLITSLIVLLFANYTPSFSENYEFNPCGMVLCFVFIVASGLIIENIMECRNMKHR